MVKETGAETLDRLAEMSFRQPREVAAAVERWHTGVSCALCSVFVINSLVDLFLFSSRRRHTRFDCDWSSDVCSSDLLAPGFSYAEESVGTNGIGTALESGQAAHVFGHEHYAEHLEDLACAAVPIRHPISGKDIGAVNLTCWRKHADGLLIALAKTAAGQITQALLTDASARESQLLQEYL